MSASNINSEIKIINYSNNYNSHYVLECNDESKSFLKPCWIYEEQFDEPLILHLHELIQGKESKKNPLLEKSAKQQIFDTLFPDPLCSFIGLVINALDSNVPFHNRLGQHGIGFLSSLSFLNHKETKGCRLSVQTTYEYKGQSFSYKIDVNKGNKVTFTKIETQDLPGTTVSIAPVKNLFSMKTLENLSRHLFSLQFYEHGSILVRFGNQSFTLGQGNLLAKVILTEKVLSIIDDGPGISLEAAQTQIFGDIPTPFSMALNDLPNEIKLPELVDFKGKKEVDRSYFLISVGGCIINTIPFKEKEQSDLLLKFPASTRLTLAKDAIEMKANGKRAETYLKQVIDCTIEEIVWGNSTSERLLLLHRGLIQWENDVPAIKKIAFSKYVERRIEEKILKNPELVAIPYEQKDFYRNFSLGKKPIPIHGELIRGDFRILEQILVNSWSPKTSLEKQALERKIIAKKSLLFIADEFLPKRDGVALIADFGLATLLFVPLSLIDYATKRSEIEKQSVEKILAFSISHRYCPEGIRIFPYSSLSCDDEYIRIAVATPKSAISSFELQTSSTILEKWDDSFFSQFWNKYQALSQQFLSTQNRMQKIFFYDAKQLICALPKIVDSGSHSGEERISRLFQFVLRMIFTANGNYYFIKDKNYPLQSFISWLTQVLAILKDENGCVDKLKYFIEYGSIFEKATSAELGRITFDCFLRYYSLHDSLEKTVFLGQKCLWPNSIPCLENLEKLFFSLYPYETSSSLTYEYKKYPKKYFYFSKKLTHLRPQTLGLLDQLDTLALKITLKRPVIPLAVVHDLIQKEETVPIELKSAMARFFEEVILLFRDSFTFKDHQIQFPYGQIGNPFSIAHPTSRFFSCDDVSIFLLHLAKYPSLFKKLLNLSLDEYLYHFNQERILRKISELQTFALPENLLNERLIHGFSRLFENLPHLLMPLLSEIETWEQAFFMLAMILWVNEAYEFFKDPNSHAHLTFFVQHYLRKIPAAELLNDIERMVQMKPHENLSSQLSQGLCKVILEYIRNYRNETVSSLSFIDFKEETPVDIGSFTVTQLLNAIDRNELTFDSSLEKLLLTLNRQAKKETRSINQRVEHGGTRKRYYTTFIECLQKSVDAIKAFEYEAYKASVDLRQERQENWEDFLTRISFKIELVETRNSLPQIAVEIQDGIGVKNLACLFVDLFVTNISEKSISDSGNIGNRFFQIFKGASHVILKTRLLEDPSQVLMLRILPLRNENREVVDFSIKVFDLSSDEMYSSFFGSEIRVFFQNGNKSKEELLVEISEQRKFLFETISNTLCHSEDGREIQLFLKSEDNRIEPLSVWGEEKIFFKSKSFIFQRTKQPEMAGLVLTNGLPFKPLSQFLGEMDLLSNELADRFSFGWCLDLSLDSFTPVRSHSELRFKKGKKQELQELVAEWLYMRCLFDEPLGPGRRYFPHFDSHAPFLQVYPAKSKKPTFEELISSLQKGGVEVLPDFFVYYPAKYLDNGCFINAINIGYNEVVHKLIAAKSNLEQKLTIYDLDPLEEKYKQMVSEYQQICGETFSTWKKNLEKFKEKPLKEQFLKMIIFPWFENKIPSFLRNIKSLEELKNDRPELKTETEKNDEYLQYQIVQKEMNEMLGGFISVHKIFEFAEEILLSYCQIHCAFNQKKPPSIIFIDHPYSSRIAFYSSEINSISVNLSYLSFSEILSHALALYSKQMIYDGTSLPLVAISLGKSGELNHELEHLRRNEEDSRGNYDVHSDATDEKGRKVSFEACAASFARKALQMGLCDIWAERIVDFMKKNAISEETLVAWIQKLKFLETNKTRMQLNALLLTKPESTKKRRRLR